MTVFALFTRPAWSQAAIFAGQPLGSGPRKSPRNPGSSHHTPNSAERERARRRGSRIWGQRRRPGGPRAPPPPRGSALQGPSPPQGVPGGPLGFSGPDGGCAPRKAIEPPHESLLGSRPRGGAVSSAGRRPSGPASTPRRSAGSQRSETCPTRGDSRAAPGDSGAAPGDSGAAPGASGAAPGDSRAAPGGSRGRHRLRTRLASRRAESSSGDLRDCQPASEQVRVTLSPASRGVFEESWAVVGAIRARTPSRSRRSVGDRSHAGERKSLPKPDAPVPGPCPHPSMRASAVYPTTTLRNQVTRLSGLLHPKIRTQPHTKRSQSRETEAPPPRLSPHMRSLFAGATVH